MLARVWHTQSTSLILLFVFGKGRSFLERKTKLIQWQEENTCGGTEYPPRSQPPSFPDSLLRWLTLPTSRQAGLNCSSQARCLRFTGPWSKTNLAPSFSFGAMEFSIWTYRTSTLSLFTLLFVYLPHFTVNIFKFFLFSLFGHITQPSGKKIKMVQQGKVNFTLTPVPQTSSSFHGVNCLRYILNIPSEMSQKKK